MAEEKTVISPDDSRIGYSDFVHMEQASDPASPSGKTVRFDRILDMNGTGYRWDNPGARIRFRTDAPTIEVFLSYTERHISKTARNPIGRYWIDGQTKPEWTFHTQSIANLRPVESVSVVLASPDPSTFHDYDLVLPYGDSVELQGLGVPAAAHFETPAPRPSFRYVAYGDSITHGFSASEAAYSYAFLVAEKKNWQILNMGLGGRSSTASDGAVVASLAPDLITVLMGVNDWQAGVPLADYHSRMEGFLAGIRATRPQVPIYLITPLWVHESWKPIKAIADLESYRQVLRDLVAAHADPNLHLIEGPSLIDHDQALFNQVAVHPNDQGFAQMADRLAALLPAGP